MTRSHLASQRAVLDTREQRYGGLALDGLLAALLALALLRASPVLAAGVVGTGTPASCTEDALDTALDGGGLVTFNCGPDPVTITITSTKTISADTTIDGGGTVTVSGGDAVGVFSVDSGIRFTVQYLTVAHGSTTTGSGGGILNGNGIVAVTNSTFSGNSTIRCAPVVGCGGQPGGAIYNGGTLTVANSTFSGNTAGGGGGGISNSGALTVTNSTFSDNGNVSSGRGIPGGGIGNSGTATVINSTFSGNHPGDIYSHTVSSYTAALTLANSILYSCVSYAGTVTDGGHNLIGIATSSCGQTDGVNGNIVGFDPGLDPAGLKDNGGPTQTIALQPDSRAINAGDQAVCAAPPVNNLDQRGYIRPGAGATNCSIGAFEANALPPCAGDCNGNAQVTVDEILTLVNIALGNTPMTDCSAGDTNHDNQITVDEILAAVNNALNGCPPLPTPLPTQTPTMTSTATVTPTGPPAATTTPTTAATGTATAVPPTPTGTPTWTPTLTPTPTQTPTATNTPRFVDNGDGTITDGQTQLVWEKKSDDDSLHDKDSYYSWAGTCSVGGAYCQPSAAAADACAAGTGSTSTVGCAQCPSGETCNCASAACNTNGANPVPGSGNNSTIWQWLVWLNSGSGFAGATDWRIPTINAANYGDATGAPAATELETILRAAFPCEGFNPCAWPAFNTGCTAGCTVTTCSCTQSSYYWSATSFGGAPMNAWAVYFANGHVDFTNRSSNYYVRAVRGGS